MFGADDELLLLIVVVVLPRKFSICTVLGDESSSKDEDDDDDCKGTAQATSVRTLGWVRSLADLVTGSAGDGCVDDVSIENSDWKWLSSAFGDSGGGCCCDWLLLSLVFGGVTLTSAPSTPSSPLSALTAETEPPYLSVVGSESDEVDEAAMIVFGNN